MKHYTIEDDLYLFGFSRGAYTARFLAEMLDQIGLINAGNEELVRFTWKTYADWAARKNKGTKRAQLKEDKQYEVWELSPYILSSFLASQPSAVSFESL